MSQSLELIISEGFRVIHIGHLVLKSTMVFRFSILRLQWCVNDAVIHHFQRTLSCVMQVTSTTMIQRLNMKSQSSWNRTASISAVARIVGALAVCISMGFFPQVRGQTNYTVGSGFVNGSLWTNTIDGLVEAGILENAYKQWADSVLIKEGDTLSKYLYASSEHFQLLLEM